MFDSSTGATKLFAQQKIASLEAGPTAPFPSLSCMSSSIADLYLSICSLF